MGGAMGGLSPPKKNKVSPPKLIFLQKYYIIYIPKNLQEIYASHHHPSPPTSSFIRIHSCAVPPKSMNSPQKFDLDMAL